MSPRRNDGKVNLHLRAATRHFRQALQEHGFGETVLTPATALHAAWMLDLIEAIQIGEGHGINIATLARKATAAAGPESNGHGHEE